MKSRTILLAAATVGAALVLGCGGDIGEMMTKNPAMQDKVMSTIAAHSDLAGPMIDRFLGNDTTRTLLIDKLMMNGAAKQSLMANIARNEGMIDGVMNFAVQDTAMRKHVLDLLKGMQMMGGK